MDFTKINPFNPHNNSRKKYYYSLNCQIKKMKQGENNKNFSQDHVNMRKQNLAPEFMLFTISANSFIHAVCCVQGIEGDKIHSSHLHGAFSLGGELDSKPIITQISMNFK